MGYVILAIISALIRPALNSESKNTQRLNGFTEVSRGETESLLCTDMIFWDSEYILHLLYL